MALTTALEPGQYQVTCGLRSNPKAMLLVEEDSLPVAGPAPAPNLALQIAAYKLYVRGELIALVGNTRALVDAVKAGKLSDARRAYAPAHQRYERVEPVATLFDDLDTRMDSRADDFARKEADPNFLGFHRLEKALFADHSTQGMAPVADRLMADALDLQKRVDGLAIPARVMVGGPDELIEDVASTKMLGQEDRYSRTDLWDLQANIDGAHKIYALLQPQIHGASPALDQSIRSTIARVDTLLAKYRVESDGFESYDKLSKQDRATLRGQVAELAGDFARLRDTLGLD